MLERKSSLCFIKDLTNLNKCSQKIYHVIMLKMYSHTIVKKKGGGYACNSKTKIREGTRNRNNYLSSKFLKTALFVELYFSRCKIVCAMKPVLQVDWDKNQVPGFSKLHIFEISRR